MRPRPVYRLSGTIFNSALAESLELSVANLINRLADKFTDFYN